MKTIKSKLLVPIIAIVFVAILCVSIISQYLAGNALKDTAASNMKAITEQGVKVVNSRVKDQKDIIELLASKDVVRDEKKTDSEKFAALSEEIKKYDYVKMGITDLQGNIRYSNGTKANISDRAYFKQAMNGQVAVSDPLISSTEHFLVVVYMAPIKVNDKIVGFLSATKKGTEISSISSDITYGKSGRAFMIDKKGTKIAHYDSKLVNRKDNDLVNVKKNPQFKSVAALEQKMANGEQGSGEYTYNGKEKMMYYVPVTGTGWSLAVVDNKDEILANVSALRKWSIILTIAFIAISSAIVYIITNKISNGIKAATDYITPIASGDFSKTIDKKHLGMKDETGRMLNAISLMQESIKKMMMTVMNNSEVIYKDSQKLSQSSSEMDSSSSSVVDAIKEVAAGTTSQAQDLVKITEVLDEFSKNLDRITKGIEVTDSDSKKIMKLTSESNVKFDSLSQALEENSRSFKKFSETINNSSSNIARINEITDLINSVAEQTNLLALNAAIEAARAGEAGKGFAVVAEEIRTLAEQSKVSAEDISKLIETISNDNRTMISTTKEVGIGFNKQNEIIGETIQSFGKITESINNIIPEIQKVSKAAADIDKEKNNIIDRVESTTAVSEETSAAAEEILASSSEIKNSSEIVAASAKEFENSTTEMMDGVKKFKL